ncbi:probable polyamine oxidase 4 isoform X2 [Andrographis paniculata]|uniref:probable polyamine oxidase 4 isoform X2 n=1 Tax=Andrographis paniculata TaxID=175694 RepID=UPI0021E86AEC|nr:probable polyamine oxidase 4 isoform X2 [Andrographis paniculata]XP_051132329.1 probable polyamine oxidase 4 isoform X2 [Andrographis paniculata]XP_051132337.1 probable polyamine oxidase 4 isoform X2 [Andrographis paniculata]
MNGNQVLQSIVTEVGVAFKKNLKEMDKVRNEQSNDISVKEAISIVMDRNQNLRQKGVLYEVLQWYICRMEAWFVADAEDILLAFKRKFEDRMSECQTLKENNTTRLSVHLLRGVYLQNST